MQSLSRRVAAVAVAALLPLATPAADDAELEVRQVFERFVAAQNAHDSRTVKEMLWDGPGFLWITRGTPIWGRDAAIQRFEANYAGTWKLEPDLAQLHVTRLDGSVAEIFVPLVVTAGPAGQAPQAIAVHMNQVLIRTPGGWRIASILPIPVPRP
ncbi:MAG TPA: nuclear transport factor 2 family protein [Anaeromyxobacteraceae bacterium]|nr:nuclear transport factor 2 family protein [Anaeromyxobacteraceae bacterium]